MKILILGGTRFMGRHLSEFAVSGGHEVTLFNRGESLQAPAGMESLKGDRDGGLRALRGRTWDVAIDTCGFVPRVVRESVELLAGNVGHYTFVSSMSVVADAAVPGQTEDTPLATLDDESGEEVTGERYGGLKVLCERVVEDVFGERSLVVRPGLIVGPYDTTDRFPYWPRRVARGGEVLAPGVPDAPVQFIDARDLAAWILRSTIAGLAGTFHATGPGERLSFGAFLKACADTLGAAVEFTWIDEAFLLDSKVAPFTELPLWLPAAAAGFNTFDCSKAIGAGLTYRPLEDTIRDTHTWDATRTDADRVPKSPLLIGASLAASRERELLDAWRTESSSRSTP